MQYMEVSSFFKLFLSNWILRLFLVLSYYKQCGREYPYIYVIL